MRKSFEAVLETRGSAPQWVGVRIPFDLDEVWPDRPKARAGLRVKGSVRNVHRGTEGFRICTSLLKARDGSHFLLVTQKMRKGAQVAPGELAEIVLEPDQEGQAATPPPELAKLLKQDREVRKWYEQLNYSLRKYIADMIKEPKSKEVRQRRAEVWMERILSVMEGEVEAPPILQVTFRRYPMAQAGWAAMTGIQRRNHLMGVACCESPEAREKRAEMAAEDAARVGARKLGARRVADLEE